MTWSLVIISPVLWPLKYRHISVLVLPSFNTCKHTNAGSPCSKCIIIKLHNAVYSMKITSVIDSLLTAEKHSRISGHSGLLIYFPLAVSWNFAGFMTSIRSTQSSLKHIETSLSTWCWTGGKSQEVICENKAPTVSLILV